MDSTATCDVQQSNGNGECTSAFVGGGGKLVGQHLDELRASGLSGEMIEAAGFYSELLPDRIKRILNWKSVKNRYAPALVIPFRDQDGEAVLKRVKLNVPRTRNGKAIKYESPIGSRLRAYFPPGVHEKLKTPQQEAIVTEGEKKSAKAAQEGFPAVGLTGVDCWHIRKSSALLPDLAEISWKGRPVYICFDSDAADNTQVRDNECLLAAALTREGADVKVVRLPGGSGDDKVGLDDFLVAHGPGALRKLLDEAVTPEQPNPEELRSDAGTMDPAVAVEHYLDTGKADGLHRLRFWRGGFLLWTGGAYREIPPSEIRAHLLAHLNERYSHVATFHVANCIDQIKAQTILAGRIESPSWIEPPKQGHASRWKPEELLSTRSEIINLRSLATGEPHSIPATPRLFTSVALDCKFSLAPPTPTTFFDFLDQLWGDDQASKELLQEWFGYCLTPDTRQQKILMLIGPKRSGKGTLLRVLREVVGRMNVAGPTLASLAQNFGLWPLVGKSVAIVSDARLGGRTDSAVVVERLLSISGEDTLTIDRKFQEPVTVKLPTRFTIISNELPRLSDSSGALSSRMLMLRLTKSFLGKEDPGLTNKLLAELPGILLWAVQGWQRLNQRGYFLQSESGKELLGELEDLTSPIMAFVQDKCRIADDARVTRDSLYTAYLAWCAKSGRKHTDDRSGFGRALRAAIPELRSIQPRENGDRVRYYEGIDLLSPEDGF